MAASSLLSRALASPSIPIGAAQAQTGAPRASPGARVAADAAAAAVATSGSTPSRGSSSGLPPRQQVDDREAARRSPATAAASFGRSPRAGSGDGPHGRSPPGAGWDGSADARSARSFFNRLKWDSELVASDYTVGFLAPETEPAEPAGTAAGRGGRAAGRPAGPLRRGPPRLVEEDFPSFLARPDVAAMMPRIRYFRRLGQPVWESAEYAAAAARAAGAGGGSPTAADSWPLAAGSPREAGSWAGGSGGSGCVKGPHGPPAIKVTFSLGPPRRPLTATAASADVSPDVAAAAAAAAATGTTAAALPTSSSSAALIAEPRYVRVFLTVLGREPPPLPGAGTAASTGGGAVAAMGTVAAPPRAGGRGALAASLAAAAPEASAALAGPLGRSFAAAAEPAAEVSSGLWLPDVVWSLVLSHLRPRELCVMAQVSPQLRRLVAAPEPWTAAHLRLFGRLPAAGLAAGAVRRACRSSELRATAWIDFVPDYPIEIGPAGTGACVAFDAATAVSGDGAAVRLWSPLTGRKIATLTGHAEAVTCLAVDETHVLSGDAGGGLRLWGLDDLRCGRPQARAHSAGVGCCQLLPGLPLSGGGDGRVRIWDASLAASVADLDTGGACHALYGDPAVGRLYTGGAAGAAVWDLGSAQLLCPLAAPAGRAGGPGPRAVDALHARGPLLALARGSCVELWDVRLAGAGQAAPIARLDLGREPAAAGSAGGAGGLDVGGWAAADEEGGDDDDDDAVGLTLDDTAGFYEAGGSGSGARSGLYWAAPPPAAAAAGVQLDDWKLVCADGGGVGGGLRCYDLRALPAAMDVASGMEAGAGPAPWAEPLWRMQAGAAVQCLRFCGSYLLAGCSGGPFRRWEFDGGVARRGREARTGDDGGGAGEPRGGSGSPEEGSGRRSRTKGKGSASVHRERGRYPKRTGYLR